MIAKLWLYPCTNYFTFSKNKTQCKNKIIGKSFVEVYIKSSLKSVINRDVKGLYKKALKGEIHNFIGVDPLVPYEPPNKPDLILDTETENLSVSINKLLKYLLKEGSVLSIKN